MNHRNRVNGSTVYLLGTLPGAMIAVHCRVTTTMWAATGRNVHAATDNLSAATATPMQFHHRRQMSQQNKPIKLKGEGSETDQCRTSKIL